MTTTEEDFPRGGSVHVGNNNQKRKRANIDQDLFKTHDDGSMSKKKKKARPMTTVKKIAIKKKKDKASDARIKANLSEPTALSNQICTPGMLVLGVIKSVHDYHLDVSLPNNIHGRVPITAISDAYTNLLKRLAKGDFLVEEVKSLGQLFKPGMLVRCKFTEVQKDLKGRPKITLSLNPSDINSCFTPVSLRHGMVLTGCVSSCEDHGYIVDLGVKGIYAFLKKTDAKGFIQDHNEGQTLSIGSMIHCRLNIEDKMEIMAGENRSVQLTVNPKDVFRSEITKAMGVKISTLIPGMRAEVSVTKAFYSGISVNVLSYDGFIHRSHMERKPKNMEPGQKITACVLYVHPVTKVAALTCLPHLLTPDLAPRRLFGELEVGDVLEEKPVIKVEDKHGVYIKINNKINGYATIGNLSDTKVKDVSQDFPKGTSVTCRIVDLCYSDKLAIVSMKKSILERTLLKFDQLTPGQDLEGEVKLVTKGGVTVQLSSNMKGFIPASHLADIPLLRPEKRFPIGKKISCKVLSVDVAEKKVILTSKNALINSKFPQITSYTDAERGMKVEGTVNKITIKGVRLLFYNNITGFIPRGYFSDGPADHTKDFHIGQVVKGTVIRCIPNKQKLIISLKTTEDKKKPAQTIDEPTPLSVGQVVSVRVKTRTARGFVVDIEETNRRGFLPAEHLSDYLSHARIVTKILQEGDKLDNVMVFNFSKLVMLTKKPILLQAVSNEEIVTELSDLKSGSTVPGVIRSHKEYGVFVELTNNLIGLTPSKYTSDVHVAIGTCLHHVGQSVICKVTEVDEERGRFLLSLRLKDCHDGDLRIGTELVNQYLDDMEEIQERYHALKKAPLASHKIGEIVKVTITKVTGEGALCMLPDGINAVVTEDHMTGVNCEQGSKFDALVLFVDLEVECLEVSLKQDLIKNVRSLVENKFSKARHGQIIKSEVLLIKEDFVLIALKGHAVGRLAYLPAKRHLNDMLERSQYEVTQVNAVVIKSVTNDRVIASLQIHEPKEKKDQKVVHHLRAGEIVDAKISKVLPFQMNIVIERINARIHVSEVTKKCKEGKSPLSLFKKDQEVKVKVVGFRELKTNKHLPVTHSMTKEALPECTLMPSKVKKEGLSEKEDIQKSNFSAGDHVPVYIEMFTGSLLWVHVTPKFRGRIKKDNISEDESVRESPLNHYKVGKCYMARVTGPAKGNVLPLSFVDAPEVPEGAEEVEVTEGSVVNGRVVKSSNRGLVVRLSATHAGHVGLTDISDEYSTKPWLNYEPNDKIQVAVINAHQPDKCVFSLRNSRLNSDNKGEEQIEHPELSVDNVAEGAEVYGYISKTSSKCCYVTLGWDLGGHFPTRPKQQVEEGDLVKCRVNRVDTERKMTAVTLVSEESQLSEEEGEEDDEEDDEIEEDGEDEEEEETEDESSDEETADSEEEEEEEELESSRKRRIPEDKSRAKNSQEMPKIKKKKASKGEDSMKDAPRLSLSSGFSWDSEFTLPKAASQLILESDSEDEEEEANKDKGKSKKNRQERLAAQREEERRLVQREQHLMDESREPESAEDFDRLVLQSPDSSLIWLRYMAFFLETTEIEKARGVAERALKTISFREEQEKLNVWVAFMNLENMYGTSETLKVVFDRAVQHNEPIKVYTQLVNIYEKSDKEEAAELLYNSMIRKFNHNKDVWISFGLFYFKHKKAQSAQKLMQRCLGCLDNKHHVEILSKFAQMEFKYGEPERGRTMFENILNSYPKRTDLWSVYIDMIVKQGDMQQVRTLFERVVSQNFSAKKMKFFFKKQLDIEQKYGNEETMAAVKQKAVEFVEARESLT